MDQRLKDLKEMRELQRHFEEAATLEKQIANYEARIREGVSDKYCYYKTKSETNLGRDLAEKYAKENVDKARKFAKVFKWVRWVIILAALALGTKLSTEGSIILLLIAAALLVAVTIAKNKLEHCEKWNVKLSEKQKADIEEGKRKDNEIRTYNQKSREAALAKSAKEQKEMVKELKGLLPGMRKELAQHQAAIAASDVLAGDDKNLSVVNFLVKRLESKRANSLQEALLQHDAEKAAQDKREYENFMRDLQRQEDAQRQLQESEDRLRQTLHNAEMERQARRAVKELEGIRKDAEDARRYGRS